MKLIAGLYIHRQALAARVIRLISCILHDLSTGKVLQLVWFAQVEVIGLNRLGLLPVPFWRVPEPCNAAYVSMLATQCVVFSRFLQQLRACVSEN